MIVIILLLLLLLIFISGKRKRNISNPAIAFVFLWSIILLLDKLSFFGIDQVQDATIKVIEFGVFSFLCGCIIACGTRKIRFTFGSKTTSGSNFNYEFRYRILYILAWICILYFFFSGMRSLAAIAKGGSLNSIRVDVQANDSGSFVTNFLSNLVVLPTAYMLEAVAVVDFWFGKRNMKLFYLTVSIIALRVLSDAGRTPLMDFAIYMALSYAFIPKARKQKWAEKIKLYKWWILGIIVLTLATISRSSTSVWRQLYFYFGMSPILLQHWMSQVDTEALYTYGLTSLNGVFFPIIYLLKNLLRTTYPPLFKGAYDMIALTDSQWINILALGRGKTLANAYVSAFWFMYTDGRITGIVIGMMLYGFILYRAFYKASEASNIKRISLYFLLFQGLFFSFIRFPFAKSYYVLAIVYTFLVIKRTNYNDC